MYKDFQIKKNEKGLDAKENYQGKPFSSTTRHQYYVASIWRGSHISFKVTGFHVGLYPGRILESEVLVFEDRRKPEKPAKNPWSK